MTEQQDNTIIDPLAWDYGAEAHEVAYRHLTDCIDAMHAENEGEDDVEWPPTMAPYDGCTSCDVREVLHAAVPVLEPAIERNGILTLVEMLRGEEAPDLPMNEAYAAWVESVATKIALDRLPDAQVLVFPGRG